MDVSVVLFCSLFSLQEVSANVPIAKRLNTSIFIILEV